MPLAAPGYTEAMVSALVLVLASQLALATLLFGTTFLEQPRPRGPAGPLARWLRQRRGELAVLRRNQALRAGLGRASQRPTAPAVHATGLD